MRILVVEDDERMKDTVLKVMLATDLGELYPRNYGAGISITRLFSY